MINFQNKITGEVFGYESQDDAKSYNKNYGDLTTTIDQDNWDKHIKNHRPI